MQQTLFRQALLEGAPTPVKEAMLANPDLPGSDPNQWEAHFVHHLQRALKEPTKDDKEMKELQTQLLK